MIYSVAEIYSVVYQPSCTQATFNTFFNEHSSVQVFQVSLTGRIKQQPSICQVSQYIDIITFKKLINLQMHSTFNVNDSISSRSMKYSTLGS